MLQIDHRESHDIDLFLDDPQILPFLNPETQGIKLDHAPDSYQAGTDMLKLAYHDLGEIDFICCDSIIPDPTRAHDVQGHAIARSEEHTSELQSLMRISYAVFCLNKKKTKQKNTYTLEV